MSQAPWATLNIVSGRVCSCLALVSREVTRLAINAKVNLNSVESLTFSQRTFETAPVRLHEQVPFSGNRWAYAIDHHHLKQIGHLATRAHENRIFFGSGLNFPTPLHIFRSEQIHLPNCGLKRLIRRLQRISQNADKCDICPFQYHIGRSG